MSSTTFQGHFKYQSNENYEEYLKLMSVSWFRRKRTLHFCPEISIIEPEVGRLTFKSDNCRERSLTLGEEHMEVLPNGERVKAVTVREGDNCLITRLKSPWNLEIRREFSSQGMVQVIRHTETEMEAVRCFKRLKS